MDELLSYREAGKLVHRSPRTIRYWRLRGMVMGWQTRDGQRVRVVEKAILQAWFRQRLVNNPIHQQKMKATRRESDLHDPRLPPLC